MAHWLVFRNVRMPGLVAETCYLQWCFRLIACRYCCALFLCQDFMKTCCISSRQIICILLISFCGSTWAQVERSSLTGTVTDQQGKRIPHAKVKATETDTGLRRETEATSQGDYELV